MPPLSDRQIELRRTCIGSSDIPWLFSLWEKYGKTPQTLLETKWGERVEEPVEAMYWGTAIEPLIIQVLRERNPEWVIKRPRRTYRASGRKWAVCHLDGLIVAPDASPRILEAKVTRFAGKECPDSYYAQVQWQMAITGHSQALVAALVGGTELKTWDVSRNEEIVGQLWTITERFYHCLINHLPWEGV